MSKHGPSKRQRVLDTIVDHLFKPEWVLREFPHHYIIEANIARLTVPDDLTKPVNNKIEFMTFSKNERDLAVFTVKHKNAEAIRAAIEAIR